MKTENTTAYFDDVEKINAYINRTPIGDPSRFQVWTNELMAVRKMIKNGEEVEALVLMFNYGRAKGYRMARRARG